MTKTQSAVQRGAVTGLVAILMAYGTSLCLAWEELTDAELTSAKGAITMPCGVQCEGPPCLSGSPCQLRENPALGCLRQEALEVGSCKPCFLVHPTYPPTCACPTCTNETLNARTLYDGESQFEVIEGEVVWNCADPCPTFLGYNGACTGCWYGASA